MVPRAGVGTGAGERAGAGVGTGVGDGVGKEAGERAGAGEIELGDGEQKVAWRTERRLAAGASAGKVKT